VPDAYWAMVLDDIRTACERLRPVYDASGGSDGFVSLEVAADIARDTARTIEAARGFHEELELDNLMVKIPATAEGVPAVARAKLAYRLFQDRFSGPRWQALAARGARPQRLLWASTSTKNPAYPDTAYVDSLIGHDTITTLPEATIAAFEDHGTLAATLPDGVPDAHASLQRLAAVGVRLPEVAAVLEAEGVAAFAKSYDELLSLLRARVVEMPSAGS